MPPPGQAQSPASAEQLCRPPRRRAQITRRHTITRQRPRHSRLHADHRHRVRVHDFWESQKEVRSSNRWYKWSSDINTQMTESSPLLTFSFSKVGECAAVGRVASSTFVNICLSHQGRAQHASSQVSSTVPYTNPNRESVFPESENECNGSKDLLASRKPLPRNGS